MHLAEPYFAAKRRFCRAILLDNTSVQQWLCTYCSSGYVRIAAAKVRPFSI